MREVHRARRPAGTARCARGRSSACRSQYVVIGSPSTYSITKYGMPSLGAAVEEPRDVRVFELGEDLTLEAEALAEPRRRRATAARSSARPSCGTRRRRGRPRRRGPCRRGRSRGRCDRPAAAADPGARASRARSRRSRIAAAMRWPPSASCASMPASSRARTGIAGGFARDEVRRVRRAADPSRPGTATSRRRQRSSVSGITQPLETSAIRRRIFRPAPTSHGRARPRPSSDRG